ncbi:AraC family ligand binding domain-containing protein [Lactobacillus helveticus]|uniref:AraC-type arabinose-binding/dimerisation domain-containing protein n=1 Tax=Lactobacillus helveticus TaxID=1587 RepID=A0A6A7K2J1_LACHE|nr:AraC family ligand binding domain-containing protein [Lactobacillus helveticus]MPW14666.1 hypothetical protein [Lactobacillus helveticus]
MKWGEFQTQSSLSTEANISFYGLQRCESNYAFKGNNMRAQYVVHYIKAGKGMFMSINHRPAYLKQGDLFILPRSIPCFYKADSEDPWVYQWIGSRVFRFKLFI